MLNVNVALCDLPVIYPFTQLTRLAVLDLIFRDLGLGLDLDLEFSNIRIHKAYFPSIDTNSQNIPCHTGGRYQ